MNFIGYYWRHSFINQVKKLFRASILIFIVVCLIFGVVIGLGIGFLGSKLSGDDAETTESVAEDAAPPDSATIHNVIELGAGALILLFIALAVLTADKSGGSAFLGADTVLLFTAPIKPQTVLLFRLLMQTGAVIAGTFYIFFQILSLAFRSVISTGSAFALLGAWIFLLVYHKLFSVLFYTLSMTHPRFKKALRPTLYGTLLLLTGAYLLYAARNGYSSATLFGFFNAPPTRYIPFWGWLKGAALFAMEGKPLASLLSFGALLLLAVALIIMIWGLKADFYEDAAAKTAAREAALETAAGGTPAKRRKDRSESLRRDGFSHGEGATVYWHKTFYNRFRFAPLGFLTKTTVTYFLVSLVASLFLRFGLGQKNFATVALLLGGLVFFRALGNPIAGDVEQPSFFLVPDTARRKVFFSFAAGFCSSALDLLPAFLLGAILCAASPLSAILWLLLILSLDVYADGVGLCIGLALATGLSQTVRSLVQICFIYFGMIPAAGILVWGFATAHLTLSVLLVVLFHLLLGALTLFLSPRIIEKGKK